jgi:Flp pilus assembly protein TadG
MNAPITFLAVYLRDRRANTAVEFALILPGFLFFTLGVFNLSAVLWASTSLHQAVEGAARYASVTAAATGADPGQAAVCAWAVNHYKGPAVFTQTCAGSPAPFIYVSSPTAACAHVVTGTGSYQLVTGILNKSLALSAKACFP